jgi:hypothetical protein
MPASGEHDNPNPTGNSPKTNPERKHPLEYGIFGFVVLTAVFTGLGAYYT